METETSESVTSGGDSTISMDIPIPISNTNSNTNTNKLTDIIDTSNASNIAKTRSKRVKPFKPFKLIQFGIRGLNPHQREQVEKYDISLFEMMNIHDELLKHNSNVITNILTQVCDKVHDNGNNSGGGNCSGNVSGSSDNGNFDIISNPNPTPTTTTTTTPRTPIPIYISFDMDVLDPSVAPGVSHREPGGLSTREAIRIIQALPSHFDVIGVDIVEYNPNRDFNYNFTATTAAKIIKEIIGVIASNHIKREKEC